MDYIRGPVQFFYRFHNSFCKENGTLVVVRKQVSISISKRGLSFKIFVVVYKIYLDSFLWNGCYLYNQGHIHVINHQVHPR